MAGYAFRDPVPSEFLLNVSEFVQDTLNSTNVRTCPYYDYPAIVNMVKEFYGGREDAAGKVDWWLSFEVWRRSIEGAD